MPRDDQVVDQPGLAGLLRERRRVAGLTQRQLAERAGVGVGTVRDLEQGRTSRPRPESLAALATVLGIDLTQRPVAPDDPGNPNPPDRAGPGLWLEILGPLRLWRDRRLVSVAERKQRTILGLLALAPNTPAARADLIDTLWGTNPPPTAASLVQDHISALRRALGPAGVLAAVDGTYLLRVNEDELDVLAFQRLAEHARRAGSADDHEQACHLFEQALALWRGTPLANWPAGRGHHRVVALDGMRTAAICDYADVAVRCGRHRRIVPCLQDAAAADPLDERVHARLMLALAGNGQQAGALAMFTAIRQRLDTQLGIRPGPELADAYLRVLRQQVPLARQLPPIPAPPAQLPNGVRHFSGRHRELRTLTGLLDQAADEPADTPPVIAVLHGPAGVGKTALAIRWARQVAHRFPDGQLHTNLHGFDATPTAPAEVLLGFLAALGVPAPGMPVDLAGRVARYRGVLAHRRVLVVLDNAASAEQVRPLLPGTASCLVLVTSRGRLTGLAVGDGAQALPLGYFRYAEAYELLGRLLGAQRVAEEPDAADALIELCAGLPLALSIAVNRSAAHAWLPLATIVRELREAANPLDLLATGDADTDLRTALARSYRRVSAAAARLFRLLGQLGDADVSVSGAASLAGIPPADARRLLGELTDVHLLDQHLPDRFGLHGLVRAYAGELGDATGTGARHRETAGTVATPM